MRASVSSDRSRQRNKLGATGRQLNFSGWVPRPSNRTSDASSSPSSNGNSPRPLAGEGLGVKAGRVGQRHRTTELVPMTAGRSMSPSAAAMPFSCYAQWLCPVGSPATEWLGLLATSNTGLSNEKKNPVKLRPVAAGNGLPAALPRSRNHQRFLAQ
jgi:hypothetical protein